MGRERTDQFRPADYQPALPLDRLIVPPGGEGIEEVPVDVLFVGGGPAGLAGAIRLAQIAREDAELGGLEIAVLEKAERLGDHCLSGAVLEASALRSLFPEESESSLPVRGRVERDRMLYLTRGGAWRVPVPGPMRNEGRYVCSICELVRWLGERAEALGVHVLTGQPAASLLMDGERVLGVRTAEGGLGRDGERTAAYQGPTDVTARVTVLAEGARGSLSQAWMARAGVGSPVPQIYALGVKELWEVPKEPDGVLHTMGWPLPASAFGGSFCYPMGRGLMAVGMVVGLDWPGEGLDVHGWLQRWKTHPRIRPMFEGGRVVEWGARVIPEGGYYAIPSRLVGEGVVLAGDSAGLVNVASLKGIHYAMGSGMAAAEAIAGALRKGEVCAAGLAGYERAVREGWIGRELWRWRGVRLGFKRGPVLGALGAGLALATRGWWPRGVPGVRADADEPRRAVEQEWVEADGSLTLSKADANYRSGNTTRDDIPVHVVAGSEVPAGVGRMLERLCPAGVYEWDGSRLVINAPNCIDCKATDVLGPRWLVREAGSGPRYERM